MQLVSKVEHDADAALAVREKLAAKPDGVIESIARELSVPTRFVLAQLPEAECVVASSSRFDEVWSDVTTWGDILFIVHTPEIVFECVGGLPSGSYGRGYFNFHGESPISGHLKADSCQSIAFVDRLFHGRRSCSIQFFNTEGEAVFKIFVRRDEKRELIAEQVGRFEALRAKLKNGD